MMFDAYLTRDLPYLEYVCVFSVVVAAVHAWLDLRQLQALKNTTPPSAVKHLFKPDECEKKAAYQRDKLKFGLVHSVYDTAMSVAMLVYAYYPWVWRLSGRTLVMALGWSSEITQSMVWVVLLSVFSNLMNLPWSLYSIFVLEERHGFNKTTVGTFLGDIVKSTLVTLAISPPIIAGLVKILMSTGPIVALYIWGFLLVVSLVMLTIYPVMIAPLFNRYEPLQPGKLKDMIEGLASKLQFPLKKLFVIDGSKRSAHSNAYMYGFFSNKRIVLYDTLLSQCSEEQVTAVLAHELGHWALSHTKYLFIASQIVLGAQMGLFAALRGTPGLLEAFGFVGKGNQPVLAGLVLFQMLIGPLDEALGLLQNLVSRTFEYQADNFAVRQGYAEDLKGALCILDKSNKGPPNTDWLYSIYHHSHPMLSERIESIDRANRKTL